MGILAFRGSGAVGWCSLGPRSDFPWLVRSRILAPVDELPVWSIWRNAVKIDSAADD